MLTGASYSALNISAFDGDIHQTQIKKSFFVGEACISFRLDHGYIPESV